MSRENQFDVIIIGTGAGGGTLAYHLAPSGKRILILERGDYVPREKDNWNPQAVNVQGTYTTKELWRDGDGKELHPHTNYYVGGNTKFYGAALFRLRQKDYGEIRHHGGISPAWPISYDEMEPYYTQAENLYQVHGNRGEDPTEPPAGKKYPWPAVSHEPRIQHLADDFRGAGLNPFHTPLGVMLDEKNPRLSRCIRCNTCDGFPCLVHAKSDAQVLCIDPALEYPNVTLLRNALVKRLETDGSGREVREVIVERNGALETYSPDIVIVACGAINSAALLLRSANDKHPNGLANRSDVVGRHYMGHTNSVVMAISKCPNPTIFQKTLSVDPDGHPLEILEFPPDKGADKWHRPSDKLFLGIDHTAIVVGDTEASLRFYRDRLGMRIAGESENYGTEQEHLSNVFGARLRITSLRAGSGPGVELLEYLSPRDGSPLPSNEHANDVIHRQTVLVTHSADQAARDLLLAKVNFVSSGVIANQKGELGYRAAFIVRDPDGHPVEIEQK